MSQANRSVEAVARAASNLLPASFRDDALAARFSDGIIGERMLERWGSSSGLTTEHLMRALLPLAASMAQAPVSGFHVGAVLAATGRSRALYLGANYEFEGAPLSSSVHAEQSAVNRAWLDGATSAEALAATAPPCGHCRQFLSEVRTRSSDLRVLTPEGEVGLGTLLPHAFKPEALGVKGCLLDPVLVALNVTQGRPDELSRSAIDAASRSYVPYSKSVGGAALRLSSGAIVTGRSCENAAYNPSLSPIQSAIAVLGARRPDDATIQDVVLAEEGGPVRHGTRDCELLSIVAPEVPLRRVVVLREP